MDFIEHMRLERQGRIQGIYWLLQINTAYNSNRIEGSTMTHFQTQHLFEKNEVPSDKDNPNVLVDDILDHVEDDISPEYMKELHRILKDKTSDEKNPLTPVGEYKKEPNVIGSAINPVRTTAPEKVSDEINELIQTYDNQKLKSLEEIVDFHVKFESIHPFADGNGRVGRLLVLKETMKNNLTPSLILSQHETFYKNGLKEYREGSKERLIDTFKAGQDYVESILEKVGFDGNINDKVTACIQHEKDTSRKMDNKKI